MKQFKFLFADDEAVLIEADTLAEALDKRHELFGSRPWSLSFVKEITVNDAVSHTNPEVLK